MVKNFINQIILYLKVFNNNTETEISVRFNIRLETNLSRLVSEKHKSQTCAQQLFSAAVVNRWPLFTDYF